MQALSSIGNWPVDNAAAAVVRADGSVATTGDTERVFALASVTKLLVAYGTLVAIEEGAVELDQPAGPPGATVRHLLAHASGLAFAENKVQSAPATRRIYSSAGFEVLAELITAETGIPFADYLAEGVFTPLGMSSTALTGPAGHGAESSVADLARFAAELLSPQLLGSETVADATTVQFPGLDGLLPGYGSQRPNDWGLGFEIKGGKRPHWTGETNSGRTYGHFGQSGTFLWVDPELNSALIVLTDRDFGEWAKAPWTEVSDTVATEIRS